MLQKSLLGGLLPVFFSGFLLGFEGTNFELECFESNVHVFVWFSPLIFLWIWSAV